ncbi:predicted protein [Chaetomium globosum CBS 148.51]|uniref:Uncharacterized protein n=1 Tax=Chaetomium globosum (strain ATCC 6205 / CBS 148.51 / DSM 1962 / NBRC 6347 / NRRL 1970) TaxID=306901 RepID=Q2GQP9_CHAGB|nr:uncharacterized protein CHGG_09705 [Chaetomium globosum CBS 148.51]EAQ83301.1 predicted protein [Chaetomium globosum CBS 148.51]
MEAQSPLRTNSRSRAAAAAQTNRRSLPSNASKPARKAVNKVTKPEDKAPNKNTERAFVGASRRVDRDAQDRLGSALKASETHYQLTGRRFRITLEAVLGDEQYESEDDARVPRRATLPAIAGDAHFAKVEVAFDQSFPGYREYTCRRRALSDTTNLHSQAGLALPPPPPAPAVSAAPSMSGISPLSGGPPMRGLPHRPHALPHPHSSNLNIPRGLLTHPNVHSRTPSHYPRPGVPPDTCRLTHQPSSSHPSSTRAARLGTGSQPVDRVGVGVVAGQGGFGLGPVGVAGVDAGVAAAGAAALGGVAASGSGAGAGVVGFAGLGPGPQAPLLVGDVCVAAGGGITYGLANGAGAGDQAGRAPGPSMSQRVVPRSGPVPPRVSVSPRSMPLPPLPENMVVGTGGLFEEMIDAEPRLGCAGGMNDALIWY